MMEIQKIKGLRIARMMRKKFLQTILILLFSTGISRFAASEHIPVALIYGSPNTAPGTPVESIIDNNTDTLWKTGDTCPESAWVELHFSEDIWTEGIGIYGTYNGMLSIQYWQDGTWRNFITARDLESPFYDFEWTLIDLSYESISTNRLRLRFLNTHSLPSLGDLKEVKIIGMQNSNTISIIDPNDVTMYKGGYGHSHGSGWGKTDYSYLLFDHNTYTDWQDYSETNGHNRDNKSFDLDYKDDKGERYNQYNNGNNQSTALVTLNGMCTLSRIKLYLSKHTINKGDQRRDTRITIMYNRNNKWIPVPGLTDIDMDELETERAGWHRFDVQDNTITTDKLLVKISGEDKRGLKEIELWGTREKVFSHKYIYVDSFYHILNDNEPVNYMFQFHKHEKTNDLLLHITGKGMADSPLLLELNGKAIGELFVRYLGDKPSLIVLYEKNGEWHEWTGELLLREDDFGGEIICEDIGTVQRINISCIEPNNTLTELWFHGSYVNDGPPKVKILSPQKALWICHW